MGKKKKNDNRSYAKKLLPWIIIAIISYTIAAFALQYFAHEAIDSTLTQMYFAFWCIEIFNIARIKVNKVKANSKGTKSIIKDAVDSILSSNEENDV